MVTVLMMIGAGVGGFLLGLIVGLWVEAVAVHRAERELCIPLPEAEVVPRPVTVADLAAWVAARPHRDGPTVNGTRR